MRPTHFLYRAATRRNIAAGPLVCCLCGCDCDNTVPVGHVIRDTFTRHDLCRVPSSDVACLACDHYFNHRWDVGQKYEAEYRKRSMAVTARKVTEWQRADMRADLVKWLRRGCPRGILVVALSKKKHLLPIAAVNEPSRSFVVQLEEARVVVSPETFLPLAEAFDGLMSLGAAKGEILSGNYHHATLKRLAHLRPLFEMDKVIAPWRPSELLKLVSYTRVEG